MYAVGDKVVHPWYGAGTIMRIQEASLGGLEHRYYAINIACRGNSMELLVPVDRSETIGLRPVSTPTQLRLVLLAEAEVPQALTSLYQDPELTDVLGQLLKSGSLEGVGSAVRRLCLLGMHRQLGAAGRRLFERGKELLASELAVMSDQTVREAEVEIEKCLTHLVDALPGGSGDVALPAAPEAGHR